MQPLFEYAVLVRNITRIGILQEYSASNKHRQINVLTNCTTSQARQKKDFGSTLKNISNGHKFDYVWGGFDYVWKSREPYKNKQIITKFSIYTGCRLYMPAVKQYIHNYLNFIHKISNIGNYRSSSKMPVSARGRDRVDSVRRGAVARDAKALAAVSTHVWCSLQSTRVTAQQ